MLSTNRFVDLMIALLAVMLMLASIIIAFRRHPVRPSRLALSAASLPALLMLVLFFSLAIHLHQHFRGWPAGIGDTGFPLSVIIHERIAESFWVILYFFSACIWPVAFVLCLCIRRWRKALYYLGVYAFSYLLCFGATLLAPTRFWDWWLD